MKRFLHITLVSIIAISSFVITTEFIKDKKDSRTVTTQQKSETKSDYVTARVLGELFCISHAVYHESRGESFEGQIAVAWVIKNRMGSDSYPNNACDTVYQKYQFSNIKSTNPQVNSLAWENAVDVAKMVYYGRVADPTKGAKFYYAPKKLSATPKWALKKKAAIKIGNHLFFNL